MKIRSLLLGTVAAAGLSTSAFATDLGVETGLDVCDDLGLTGLTLSSDTDCLQISGSVKYEFSWGDYNDDYNLLYQFSVVNDNNEEFNVMDADGTADHDSSFDSYLKFVATADSSFGPASAVIKLELDNSSVSVGQLYVTIGEGTVFTAGLADSIFKDGNDEPLNFLGLFHSGAVDAGVISVDDHSDFSGGTGGEVLQVVTSMDNFWIGGALEDIGNNGTLVGVVAYSTDDFKAHASIAVDDALVAGGLDDWVFHSGFEATFDTISVVGAYGANNDNGGTEQNGLISASIDLDNFVIAGSAEFANRTAGTGGTEFGYGASIASEVSDGVTVKLGYRHFTDNFSPTSTLDQVAGQIVAAVSDEVTLTGEAGLIVSGAGNFNNPSSSIYYGSGKVEWNPGGGFVGSVKGEANSLGAYKITTSAEKSF